MVLDTPKTTRAQINRRVWRDFLDCYTQHGSDTLLAQYKSGVSLAILCYDRGIRDTKVMADFFTDRYGEGWQIGNDKYTYKSDDKNAAIAEMLSRGCLKSEIARVLGISRQAVSRRAIQYDLEVAG